MKKIILFFTIFSIFISIQVEGQQLPKGFELMEIVRIRETYNSAENLSFSMEYRYADSVNPNNPIEMVSASYKLKNGRTWCRIDSVEFIQGGMYNVAVYNRDSVIMVDDRLSNRSIFQIPILDSLFREANVDSFAVNEQSDSIRLLTMYFKPDSYYRSYQVKYDKVSSLIKELSFCLADHDGVTPSGVIRITVQYINYTNLPIDHDIYNESKYIYSQGAKLLLKAPYEHFKLYVNGVLQ